MLRGKRVRRESTDQAARREGSRLGGALRELGWKLREWLVWKPADALRTLGEWVRWPFEQARWGLRRAVWGIQDRTDLWGPTSRGLATVALVLVAGAASVAGLLFAAPEGGRSSDSTAVALTSAPVAPEPQAPVTQPAPEPKPSKQLAGASPLFAPSEHEEKGAAARSSGKGKKKSKAAKTSSSSSAAGDSTKPLASVLSTSGPKEPAATSSAGVGNAVAGKQAVKVARQFAKAFVLYETGRGDKKVRKTFSETATPELRRALLRRPPRLPANVDVPKAKVLNVVPGPSRGGIYPVSVSLLRVGLTSELRLDMEPGKGKRWQVTDVLG